MFFTASLRLFFLRRLGFDALSFPRWPAVLAHALLFTAWASLPLIQMTREYHGRTSNLMPAGTTLLAIVIAYGLFWGALTFGVRVGLRASRRWDSHGDPLQLMLTATWPIPLALLGITVMPAVPVDTRQHLVLALLLYGAAALAHALANAVPALGRVRAAAILLFAGLFALLCVAAWLAVCLFVSIALGGI